MFIFLRRYEDYVEEKYVQYLKTKNMADKVRKAYMVLLVYKFLDATSLVMVVNNFFKFIGVAEEIDFVLYLHY